MLLMICPLTEYGEVIRGAHSPYSAAEYGAFCRSARLPVFSGDSQVLPPFGMVDSSRLQGSRGGISPADRIRGGLGFSTACALIPIGFMLLASGGGAQRTPSLPRLAVRFGLAICFRLSVPGIQRVIGCFLPTGFSSYDKDSLCSACCWLQTSSFGIRAVWMVS